MSKLDPLLERNLRFAESRMFESVSIMPRIPVFLVTCLDPRVDPAAVFGVELGDVVSVRNAGGRVTDGVIEDVAFISFLVEQFQSEGALFEVAIVHHSECGTGFSPILASGQGSRCAAGWRTSTLLTRPSPTPSRRSGLTWRGSRRLRRFPDESRSPAMCMTFRLGESSGLWDRSPPARRWWLSPR